MKSLFRDNERIVALCVADIGIIVDRLQSLEIFIAIAERGSLIAASRELGRSATAVSRALAELENQLGVELFTRSTRAVALTQAGQRTLDQARQLVADYGRLRDTVHDNAAIKGTITITASEMFGRLHVLPVVEDFMNTYREVGVSLQLLNRMVSFADEGVDLGFRIAQLPDSTLRAIQLGHVREVLCASPDYFAKMGRPTHPRELAIHSIISVAGARPLPSRWRFRPNTSPRSAIVRPLLVVNSVQAGLEAASRGMGIVRVLSYQSAPLEHAGAIERILADREPPPIPISLVYPAGKHLPARTRLFIDHAVDKLRGHIPG